MVANKYTMAYANLKQELIPQSPLTFSSVQSSFVCPNGGLWQSRIALATVPQHKDPVPVSLYCYIPYDI